MSELTKLDSTCRTTRELLSNNKYSFDYYQRNYKWEKRHVTDLIQDLVSEFQENHKDTHERIEVSNYRHYFLGSIITVANKNNNEKYIIDGQQRLTTLTLLLLFLHSQILDDKDKKLKAQIKTLIYSEQFGVPSFNLNVDEHEACMNTLLSPEANNAVLDGNKTESVANILERYADLEEQFPEELLGNTLPYFADWLMEKVLLIEIMTYSDGYAYTIFESMNDRGLSLTPTDMLKGYLLANITGIDERTRMNMVWKARVQMLNEIDKNEDAACIKAWLRSQYAKSIRQHTAGAEPGDYDRIGTEFHRWVRENRQQLDLNDSPKIVNIIDCEFNFYSGWYKRLRDASKKLTEGLESVFFNSDISLQYQVLLAPLTTTDDEQRALHKLHIVMTWIDIYIHRRIWNSRTTSSNNIQHTMFSVIKDIRHKSEDILIELLTSRLNDENETFVLSDQNRGFGLNNRNNPKIKRLLARMLDYIERHSGQQSSYEKYYSSDYNIEHIWANHPSHHENEFQHTNDFINYRDRIGGLLLLPSGTNSALQDLPYQTKLHCYLGQNLLAQSFHEETYKENQGFQGFINDSGLPFRAHAEFNKKDLDDRQELYRQLAERIWDPNRLAINADPEV